MKTISKTMETLMKYQKLRAAAMSPIEEEEEVQTDVDHGNNDDDDDVHLIRRTSQGFDYCCNGDDDDDDDLIPLNLEEADDDYEKLVDIFNECGDDFSYLLTNTATTSSDHSDLNNKKSNGNLVSPYTFSDNQINSRKRKRATTTTSAPSTRQKLLFQNDESRLVKKTRRE